MGTAIHYRGTVADIDRVEELEDRVVDMALVIGAVAQVWRSWPGDDPSRVVRGLLLDVVPGQVTTSLSRSFCRIWKCGTRAALGSTEMLGD